MEQAGDLFLWTDMGNNQLLEGIEDDDDVTVTQCAGEDEDDLDQIFPGIYYWSNLNYDLLKIIMPKTMKQNDPNLQRANGPKGSLADRLRSLMFNGREVSKKNCSSLLFFGDLMKLPQRRIVLMDCVLKDRSIISPIQRAVKRYAIISKKLTCRRYPPWESHLRDPQLFVMGVEDKVVLWTRFNVKLPFTFIMNVDCSIKWRFRTCQNDVKLAKQLLPPTKIAADLIFLDATIVRHRLVVTLAFCDLNSSYKHMVLDVKTESWSYLQESEYLSDLGWKLDNICFEWKDRFYIWSYLENTICYFDFEIGEWVLDGFDLKMLRNAFAQLKQNLNARYSTIEQPQKASNFIEIVASRSGTLYCLNKLCLVEECRDNLIYAMKNGNQVWKSLDIFVTSDMNGYLSTRHMFDPHCWPMGEDNILLVLKGTHAYPIWFIFNEKDGIQEFNDINLYTPHDSDFHSHTCEPAIFIQNNLGK